MVFEAGVKHQKESFLLLMLFNSSFRHLIAYNTRLDTCKIKDHICGGYLPLCALYSVQGSSDWMGNELVDHYCDTVTHTQRRGKHTRNIKTVVFVMQ